MTRKTIYWTKNTPARIMVISPNTVHLLRQTAVQQIHNKSNKETIDNRLCSGARLTVSTSGLYRKAKGAGISAVMRVLFCCRLAIRTIRHIHQYVKTLRHPQNRKYITYCNAAGGGLSGMRKNLVKFGRVVFDRRTAR